MEQSAQGYDCALCPKDYRAPLMSTLRHQEWQREHLMLFEDRLGHSSSQPQ